MPHEEIFFQNVGTYSIDFGLLSCKNCFSSFPVNCNKVRLEYLILALQRFSYFLALCAFNFSFCFSISLITGISFSALITYLSLIFCIYVLRHLGFFLWSDLVSISHIWFPLLITSILHCKLALSCLLFDLFNVFTPGFSVAAKSYIAT